MVARIDLVVHSFDLAVLVDKKTHAVGISRVRTGACAVCDRYRMIGVAKQWEPEFVPARERGIVRGRIEADTDYADIVFVEVLLMVAKSASFQCATRRAGFDEEPQEHLCAAETLQRNLVPFARQE